MKILGKTLRMILEMNRGLKHEKKKWGEKVKGKEIVSVVCTLKAKPRQSTGYRPSTLFKPKMLDPNNLSYNEVLAN